MSVGPRTRISPSTPGGSGVRVPGPTMRTSMPASGRPKLPVRTSSASSQRAQVTHVAVSVMP